MQIWDGEKMSPGVYSAKKKDGTPYYRASLTCKRKHISLGSYETEGDAKKAYREGIDILSGHGITIENYPSEIRTLLLEKAVSLINLRDNGTYIKTPIYLRQGYSTCIHTCLVSLHVSLTKVQFVR